MNVRSKHAVNRFGRCPVGRMRARVRFAHLVAGDFDAVVRYSGGNNAGHTIVVNGKKYGLHQVALRHHVF